MLDLKEFWMSPFVNPNSVLCDKSDLQCPVRSRLQVQRCKAGAYSEDPSSEPILQFGGCLADCSYRRINAEETGYSAGCGSPCSLTASRAAASEQLQIAVNDQDARQHHAFSPHVCRAAPACFKAVARALTRDRQQIKSIIKSRAVTWPFSYHGAIDNFSSFLPCWPSSVGSIILWGSST